MSLILQMAASQKSSLEFPEVRLCTERTWAEDRATQACAPMADVNPGGLGAKPPSRNDSFLLACDRHVDGNYFEITSEHKAACNLSSSHFHAAL
jgi:hypothetical protein